MPGLNTVRPPPIKVQLCIFSIVQLVFKGCVMQFNWINTNDVIDSLLLFCYDGKSTQWNKMCWCHDFIHYVLCLDFDVKTFICYVWNFHMLCLDIYVKTFIRHMFWFWCQNFQSYIWHIWHTLYTMFGCLALLECFLLLSLVSL